MIPEIIFYGCVGIAAIVVALILMSDPEPLSYTLGFVTLVFGFGLIMLTFGWAVS